MNPLEYAEALEYLKAIVLKPSKHTQKNWSTLTSEIRAFLERVDVKSEVVTKE